MTELNQDDGQARSVDPAIAYRVAVMHANELTESLILARSSLHEARTETNNLRSQLQENYQTAQAEIDRLTRENTELRNQLTEEMNGTPNDGSDDTESGVPELAASNGQVASESGA